jgi:hypothetical protein
MFCNLFNILQGFKYTYKAGSSTCQILIVSFSFTLNRLWCESTGCCHAAKSLLGRSFVIIFKDRWPVHKGECTVIALPRSKWDTNPTELSVNLRKGLLLPLETQLWISAFNNRNAFLKPTTFNENSFIVCI